MNQSKFNLFFSLKFQLCAGATLLLAVTLASISSLLIEYQKSILVTDLENTIVLQGRNIALSSAKGMLAADPEFELLPLVTRITENADKIESLVITDSKDIIQADMKLQHIGKPLDLDLGEYEAVQSDILVPGEKLLEKPSGFMLRTPVMSLERIIGFVHMHYSKQGLTAAIDRAVQITVISGAVAFLFGISLSLLLFRRISRPMDVMMAGVGALGQGDLDARIELPTRNEFRHLAEAFNGMASRLAKAQEEQLAKKLVDRELEIAHDIQSTLLPSDAGQLPGFDIGLYYQAAREVGGDYVDIIRLDETRTAFLIADVSGKGIPGLVVMAMLKIMTNELLRTRSDLRSIIRQLNISLSENMRPQMFVTMSLAVLDTHTRELRFTSAGHNPLLVYRQGDQQSSLQNVKGRPLAVFPDDAFYPHLDERSITLAPGDVALLYTDGLNESLDCERNQFGMDRVQQICDLHSRRGAQQLVDQLVRAEQKFRGDYPQHDDLTLLAVGAATTPSSAAKQSDEVESCT